MKKNIWLPGGGPLFRICCNTLFLGYRQCHTSEQAKVESYIAQKLHVGTKSK